MSEIIKRTSQWFRDMLDMKLIRDTTQQKIMEMEINDHLNSDKLKMMKKSHEYYNNKSDIQSKRVDIKWKSNAKIETGLFQKLVRQKVNYLLTLQPTVSIDEKNEIGQQYIDEVFDTDFHNVIKSVGREAIIKGVAYTIPYYNEDGELKLHKVPSEQIIPFWSDERRQNVDAFMRVYQNKIYENGIASEETVVEYWDENGVSYYLLDSGYLKPHDYLKPHHHFNFLNEHNEPQGATWDKIPLIVWRYNEDETTLLERVKTLIDNINLQASVNADLLADLPKLIYALKGYGGEDLNEFVTNLNKYFAISLDEDGDIDTLQAEPHTTSSELEIERTRKSIYEAGGGVDSQEEYLGNASGIALKFRYGDLDLDCNDLENEFQFAIRDYLWFVERHIQTVYGHQIDPTSFSYIFNRDVIINEVETIDNAMKSRGILDDLTIRENHPWYTDQVERRIKEQQVQDATIYEYGTFPQIEGRGANAE